MTLRSGFGLSAEFWHNNDCFYVTVTTHHLFRPRARSLGLHWSETSNTNERALLISNKTVMERSGSWYELCGSEWISAIAKRARLCNHEYIIWIVQIMCCKQIQTQIWRFTICFVVLFCFFIKFAQKVHRISGWGYIRTGIPQNAKKNVAWRESFTFMRMSMSTKIRSS